VKLQKAIHQWGIGLPREHYGDQLADPYTMSADESEYLVVIEESAPDARLGILRSTLADSGNPARK
jgi:hypothetical protein